MTVSRYDTEISVEDSYYELIVDDNDTIVAVLDPDVGDITFTSSDESVVTVDSQGNNAKAVGGVELVLLLVLLVIISISRLVLL